MPEPSITIIADTPEAFRLGLIIYLKGRLAESKSRELVTNQAPSTRELWHRRSRACEEFIRLLEHVEIRNTPEKDLLP